MGAKTLASDGLVRPSSDAGVLAADATAAMTFEAAVAAHYPRLLSRLALIVRDRTEARDLAQETLVRAWGSWSELRPDDLGGWLTVVGTRLALNELRRRRRRPWVRLFDAQEVPARATDDPELWEALAALRREERAALVLNVLGGYTQAEIALHLGVPDGTVASWISRGRQHLRTRLRPQE